MNKYLLNVEFYAGSDDVEDVDNGLYILSSNEEIDKIIITEIFKDVNKLLDCYYDNDFPLSYENGLNIDTLIEGVCIYTKCDIKELKNCDFTGYINGYYEIKQWQ